VNVDVYDIQGQKVTSLSSSNGRVCWNGGGVVPGTYLIVPGNGRFIVIN
jgi:hypothetical protein